MSVTAADVKKLRESTGAGMMACKNALTEVGGDFDKAVDLLRTKGEAKAAKRADKTAAEGRVVIAANDAGNAAVMLEVNCETDFVGRDENFVAFSEALAKGALNSDAADLAAVLTSKPENGSESFEAWRKELVTKIGENVQARRLVNVKATGSVGQYCHGGRIGVLVALEGGNADVARDIAMHIAASNPLSVDASEVPAAIVDKEKEIFTAQAKESGKPDNIIEKMIEGRIKKFLKEVCLLDQAFVKNPDQTVGDLLKENNAKVLSFTRYELGEGIEKEEQDFAAEVMAQVKG